MFELKEKGRKTFGIEDAGRGFERLHISIIRAAPFLHEHRYHIFVPWFGIDTIGMGFVGGESGRNRGYTRTPESR